jgi:hypothetical protein
MVIMMECEICGAEMEYKGETDLCGNLDFAYICPKCLHKEHEEDDDPWHYGLTELGE